jgi:hypothetical protein
MGGAVGVEAVVARFGLPDIVDRHVERQEASKPLWGLCHACLADVDLAPHLRDEEAVLVANLEASDEKRAIRAWTRLIDEQPWLCEACRLLLP